MKHTPQNHRQWAAAVKSRDGYTCAECGETRYLHSHHIKPRSSHPELALDMDNGVTLCRECHAEKHPGYLGAVIAKLDPKGSVKGRRRKGKPADVEEVEDAPPHVLLPERFTEAYERMGMSRAAFARALGISPNTATAYAKGRYPVPLVVCLAIAALQRGVPPAD